MKPSTAVLLVILAFMGYRMYELNLAVHQLQEGLAVAVLSAEAANKKADAIAPFFASDKDAYAKAWLTSTTLPLVVLPEEVLVPITRAIDERSKSRQWQEQKAAIFR
jgi:hypothetical protein